MKKVLISWIALNHDFVKNRVNTEGPSFDFHRHFFTGYDAHILLSNEKPDQEYSLTRLLYSELTKSFRGHKIIPRYLDIPQADVINYNHIHSKVFPLLMEFEKSEIDIFVSPGTPTMQVVWHMLHYELKLKTRLLQTVRKELTGTRTPALKEIRMHQAPFTQFHVLKEKQLSSEKSENDDYYISEALEKTYDLAYQIAQTPKTTVLITGETGTGKEHLAFQIHQDSHRGKQPFLVVNCAAISSDILESRLFGYEKGAFTGALKTTTGLFHQADTGTIFLDEIGDISPQMQIALLRVIQNGEIQKVGSAVTEKVDVRIIAATNKKLVEECKSGRFRWDLYYRLNVAELTLPPLRERGKKEIADLISFFNKKLGRQLARKSLIKFPPKVVKLLTEYTWPGNIRELQNLLERCYAYGIEEVTLNNLPLDLQPPLETNSLLVEDLIRRHIQGVVKKYNGNLTKAKLALGLGSVNTVKKYLVNEESNTRYTTTVAG